VSEVQALTKRYGAHTAVEDLSFTAPDGTVTGFIGPNGSGKTTTFRCLLGLADPTAGRALIGGRPYRALEAPRTRVGAVLETTGFHPARSGRNHLLVLARAAGIDRARVDEVLDVVGLRAAGDRRVGGYSLGMRQRLGIAAALLGDPAVIVLDEPVNGLDPEGWRGCGVSCARGPSRAAPSSSPATCSPSWRTSWTASSSSGTAGSSPRRISAR